MSTVTTTQGKYIFFDVVSFSRGRSVEAQSDIVATLNLITRSAVDAFDVDDNKVIFIPTGDGICVALLDQNEPFDIHIKIALVILENIAQYNDITSSDDRKISVRIGVNENVDNIVTDINGQRNVAGAGITGAQRVMDLGDGGNILVGRVVFDHLSQRERYSNSFRRFDARIKHGQTIEVYQYVQPDHSALVTNPPAGLVHLETMPPDAPKLTETMAYYMGYLVKYRTYIDLNAGSFKNTYLFLITIGFARTKVMHKHTTEFNPIQHHWEPLPGRSDMGKLGIVGDDRDLDSLFAYYDRVNYKMLLEYKDYLKNEYLLEGHLNYYFVPDTDQLRLSEIGMKALRDQWPKVIDDLELGAS